MEKEKLLNEISQLSSLNSITKDELIWAYKKGKGEGLNSDPLTKEVGLSEVLYFIGAFIVFIGISVLIWQNWNTLNSFTRIVATLGFGIIVYCTGVILNKEEKYGGISYAFHLMAALTMPLGLYVVFNQAGFNSNDNAVQSLIAGILSSVYISSYFVFKKSIFTFFGISYATWLFFSFTNFVTGSSPIFSDIKFYEYRFFVVGISYVLLGYYFSFTAQKGLSQFLYGFGSLFTLGAALILGGWKPSQNVIWEILFPGLIFNDLYLSTYLKSKSLLTFGTIFLMIYILKITGEYFSGTLGWPLSLIICGSALIGVGYYAFTLNKKYISSN